MKKVEEFKVLIVDDEPEARLLLKSLLEEIESVAVVGEAANAEEALILIVEHYPNLILLDINMPGISGLKFAQLLHKANIDIPIAYISAFKKYAVQAIRNGVYDFLLKPIDREDLKSIVEKYRRRNEKDLSGKLMEVLNSIKEESKIRINSRHSYILVNPSEIIFCEADAGYTNIILTSGKTEISNSTLTQIEQELSKFGFFRLGRSAIVNKEFVRSVNKSTRICVLENNRKTWNIQASPKSIKELLIKGFNYA